MQVLQTFMTMLIKNTCEVLARVLKQVCLMISNEKNGNAGPIWFLFLKTVFCSQKLREQGK